MMQFTEEQREARNPDGGLAEWIEILEMTANEDDVRDAELLCLLIELRRFRLNATVPAAPDGWKLVPVEPTPEMISAGKGGCVTSDMAREIYDDMLAVAPVKSQ